MLTFCKLWTHSIFFLDICFPVTLHFYERTKAGMPFLSGFQCYKLLSADDLKYEITGIQSLIVYKLWMSEQVIKWSEREGRKILFLQHSLSHGTFMSSSSHLHFLTRRKWGIRKFNFISDVLGLCLLCAWSLLTMRSLPETVMSPVFWKKPNLRY